jgi:two-component system cell cycle sensor histidine kinase/response regulator CckA
MTDAQPAASPVTAENDKSRHDFRNQLAVIKGFAEILLAEAPPGDKRHLDLMEIHTASVTALGLLEPAAPHPVDLRHAEALLKTGALQNAIFNSANFSSIATDARGVIQIFNVGAERMLGYKAADVINKVTPADISDPQEVVQRAGALSLEFDTPIAPGFEALVFKATRTIEDIYELTYIRKDGSRFPAVVSVTALRDAHDAIIGYLLIGTDNTARQQVEEERRHLDQRLRDYSQMLEREVGLRTADLVESERLYRSTFDAAPVGIVHVAEDGQWLRVNQCLCDLLGYACEELQVPTVQELLESEDMTDESVRAMAAGTPSPYVVDEKRYRRRDGSLMWARVITSVYQDADGRSRHFISIIQDITDLRTLEAQVRQSNKMDAIGKLASGVAHDFNNLLTVIVGFGEILSADATLAPQHRKDLSEIMRAARHASALTKQLLAFSRQQVLHTKPLDVNRLITDMTAMLGRLIGDDIHVALALAPDLSLVLADRSQLEQVVMNLVVNARDAMPAGGTVTIETKDVQLENSSFHEETVLEGQYVMLAITDTGTGMSRETRRRLFEPFFTTKATGKGTGLGLSTTYGIVRQSKGYIWVYSEPQEGTRFNVYLPRASREGAAEVVLDAQIGPPAKRASETVLLVEDEPGVRHLSKRILDTAGYRVLEAESGADAERIFALHADAIDLVITDIVMPGCGGPELLGRLQVLVPDVRVLYMSGYTEQVAATKAGIDRGLPFVQKPFTAAEFVRHVRDALDR